MVRCSVTLFYHGPTSLCRLSWVIQATNLAKTVDPGEYPMDFRK